MSARAAVLVACSPVPTGKNSSGSAFRHAAWSLSIGTSLGAGGGPGECGSHDCGGGGGVLHRRDGNGVDEDAADGGDSAAHESGAEPARRVLTVGVVAAHAATPSSPPLAATGIAYTSASSAAARACSTRPASTNNRSKCPWVSSHGKVNRSINSASVGSIAGRSAAGMSSNMGGPPIGGGGGVCLWGFAAPGRQ